MFLRRSLSKLKPSSIIFTCKSSHHTKSITQSTISHLSTISQNQSSSHSPSFHHFTIYLTAALSTILATNTSHSESPVPHNDVKGWNMLSIQQRRRHFFKYEKRIREFSSPEKIFEYFASINETSNSITPAMTPSDMMRSVLAVYPPEGSDIIRAGRLPGEPYPNISQEPSPFFQTFDIDGDSQIEFEEWLLFQALLSVPIDDVSVAFSLMDTNGDGTVEKEEFEVLLKTITKRAALHQQSLRHTSTLKGLQNAHEGLIKLFFGKKGTDMLSLQKLQQFIHEMRDELARLEFVFYDYDKKGCITGRDFAYSVVGCARMKHIDEYLNKIEAMPAALANVKVSLKDFQAFRSSWRKLHQLSVALEFWYHSAGVAITPEDFQRVVHRSLGDAISKDIVDVLFYLFEAPNGGLNVDYLLALMDRHVETGLQVSKGEESGGSGGGEKSFFDCLSKCTKKM